MASDCPADIWLPAGDGLVNGDDLSVLASDFGRADCGGDCEPDLDDPPENTVDGIDLAVLAADFGSCD